MKKLLLTCTDLMAIHFFTEHIELWTDNGYEVHLACSPVGGMLPDILEHFANNPNVSVSTLNLQRSPFSPSNYKGYCELKKHFQFQKYDCVLTNEPVMGVATRLAARKEKTKVIYIAHGFHFYKGGSKIKNFIFRNIERFIARYTDCLVTINREDYEAAKSFNLRCPGNFQFLPGIGVNTKRFSDARVHRRRMREELDLAQEDIAIAVIGELNDNKNQQVLIRAMQQLIQSYPRAKLFLIGTGKNRSAYKALIQKLNLEQNVYLLGYRRDIPDILSACDIGVSASGREGLPLNLIEEMASGLPIVASVNRGHLEIVEEGKGGFLCCENTPEEYANILLRLCCDLQLRKQFGDYNLNACKKFDISIVKDELMDIIASQIDGIL